MKENIYIQILKFGREKLESELSYVNLLHEIKKISGKNGTFAAEVAKTFFIVEIGNRVYLRGDALFNLIQYERIEETRKESKTSLRFAFAAIILNILGLVISIVLLLKG